MLVTQTSPRRDVTLSKPLRLSVSSLLRLPAPILLLWLTTAYNLSLKHPDIVAGVASRGHSSVVTR